MNRTFMEYLSNVVELEKTRYQQDIVLEGIDAELSKEIPHPAENYVWFKIRWMPLIPIEIVLFFIAFVAAFQHASPTWAYFLLCPAAAVIYWLAWFIPYLVKKADASAVNHKNIAIYKSNILANDAHKLALQKLKAVIIARRQNTTTVLETYYSRDLIYPKYRTFEQVTQLYEYLDSGRCDSLTGYTGAYNLLENERANRLILLELRQIRINTSQIAANQNLLYNAITSGFDTVSSLMSKTNTELQNINNSIQAQGKNVLTDMAEQRKYLDFIAENTAIPTYYRENYYREQRMTRWLMERRDLHG